MLPNRNVLDENVEKNFNEMFEGVKLSKKAEREIRIKDGIVINGG